MTSISIAVFIMMFVAASLGFIIAWVYKSDKVRPMKEQLRINKVKVANLLAEQEGLVKHSNNLQAEILKLSEKVEKQATRIETQKEVVLQLRNDKDFIFNEYEKFREEVRRKLNQSAQIQHEFQDLKDKNQKLKVKADKWKVKQHETERQLKETEASYLKVNKEKGKVVEQLSSSTNINPENILEQENNFRALKLKYLAISKEKEHLEQKLKNAKGEDDGNMDEMLSKLSKEVVILKKENKLLKKKHPAKKLKELSAKSSKEEVLIRIKNRTKQLDLSRIGKADTRTKDDLKKLKGLGTLIEQKFKAIGINTYYQMANLNEYDQKLLNFFLELPQGKIESEKWVLQARNILGVQAGKDKLAKVTATIEKINFDRIGAASPSQKDNLTSIIGIGPFIEQKLNAIGIFRLEQLARLSDDDIDEINGIMELAPDHIKNDDWVGQARRMK